MLQREKSCTAPASGTFFKPDIQKKLNVGASNDAYETEADAMASKVMQMAEPSGVSPSGESIQKCACQDEEKVQKKELADGITPLVQRSSKGEGESAAPSHVENQINTSRGGGSVMDNSTLNFMENRFSNDFSGVRIHTDNRAVQMSRELNAQAFTVGNDIYFNEGKYTPSSENGKHLLAHELTHTIQQSGIRRKMIQKSCSDGNCETCGGGLRDLWISVFFRVRATRERMRILREKINDAKRILRNCCINLKFDFNWNLIRGASSMDAFEEPPGDRWRFTADETAIGTGNTFSGARGIPMLVVDDVPRSGGGVTVSSTFDPNYTGQTYFIIAINQTNNDTSTIAHELSHVTGANHDETGNSTLDNGTGRDVNDRYCNSVRGLI